MINSKAFRLPLIAAASLLAVGCSSSSNNDGVPGAGATLPPSATATPTPTDPPVQQSGFDQVDRTAIPAVATLFIDPLGSRVESVTDPKNAFNLGTPDQAADFSDNIRTTLRALRSNDDNPNNDFGESDDTTDPSIPRVSVDTAVAVIAPDVLTLDLDGTAAGLLGVELGVNGAFGGRTLAGDVVDAALAVIVFPGAGANFTSDFVDTNDVPFQDQFPYAGLAHTP